MNFVIDTQGQISLRNENQLLNNDDNGDNGDNDDDDVEIEDIGLDVSKITNIKKSITKRKRKVDPNDIDLNEFERDMGWQKSNRKKAKIDKDVQMIANAIAPIKDTLKKSVVRRGFERLKRVPGYDTSDKKLKSSRKGQRNSTKGKNWFNLPATEITDEIRRDLEIIQMRSVLDPKRFYKKNDLKVLPKYFHIGKVMDSPTDYYSGRLTKKERKHTMVDELMADAQFSKYNKRKYKEIIDKKCKLQYKAYKHAKKLKRKGKNK